MNIAFSNISYNNYNSSYNQRTATNPAFCGKTQQKLIKQIMSVENNKKIHLTFDETSKIYKYLGYDVILKRGSHAIIPVNEQVNLSLPIPHGDKYVSAFDIKRLKCMINDDIEGAMRA